MIKFRDSICEVNGGFLFAEFPTFNYRQKNKSSGLLTHRGTQTDIQVQLAHSPSSSSFVTKLKTKLCKPAATSVLDSCENCFQFLDVIPDKSYKQADPEVVTWIKAKALPDVSLFIAVAMYDKLDECMLKTFLKKSKIDINRHYMKTINSVSKLYGIANKHIVIINNQNKTNCCDLIHLIRIFTTTLHCRYPQKFQLTLDVSCNVNRLVNAINFITNLKSSNVKWILNIPFNESVKYERALSSRWITNIPTTYVMSPTKTPNADAPAFPNYYSEEEPDSYYQNSMKEILHLMKFSNTFIVNELSKLYYKTVGTLPYSASSLSSLRVFVYDNENRKYLEEPASGHLWGYDGEIMVEFDIDNNRFNTPKRFVFCSNATEVMLDQKIFERIDSLSLSMDKQKPVITSIQGVPGCGKSTWILNSHRMGKDLVLSSTKHGITDIKSKVASQCKETIINYEDIKTNYRTIASYLLNGIKKYDTVYIDEYMMVHAGLLGLVALLSECRKMFILGDQNQIPYIDRLNFVNMRYFDANKFINNSKNLNTTFRCPADVVYALQPIYNEFFTTNTLTNTVSFHQSKSIADIPILPNTLYLTFTKIDKKQLACKLKLPDSSKLLTIHEAQGLTSANVICVRLLNLNIQLFESVPHALVALTRHTRKFSYYAPLEGDQLYSFVRTASKAHLQNLEHIIVKSRVTKASNEDPVISTQGLGYNNNTNLTIYFQNVNRMSSKASQFHNFVLKTLFPIYILCETSLNKEIQSSEFFPSQYVVHRCDRSPLTSSKKSGGGVLIAIDKSIPNEWISLPNLSIEQGCVKATINKKSLFVYVAYIPPDSPLTSYTACCDTIVEINRKANPTDTVLITGDFNLPSINWTYDEDTGEILPTNVSSETECLFIDTMITYNQSQLSNVVNGRNRLLDLIFTNSPELFNIYESLSPFVINDINHKAIEIILQSETSMKSHLNQRTYHNFRKADSVNLDLYFRNINWDNELNSNSVDVNVDKFHTLLCNGIDLFVPAAVTELNRYPPWYDKKLINLKNKKDKAYKEKLKWYSEASKHKFTLCNKQYEDYYQTKFKSYISCIQEKIRNDPKYFWTYFKTKRETNGYPELMTFKGQKSCDPQVISNMFANFFQSVYKPEDIDKYIKPSDGTNNVSIQIPIIKEEDIYHALKTFRDGCGPDGIPASLLKSYNNLVIPLCLLFNQSLNQGIFPQKWKITRVTPIFKSGTRNDISCYRGITSISSIPKLFELVVCNSFRTVVPRYISVSQHGFMPKRSTATNLTEFTSSTIKEIENHKQVDVVYTDFAKAFDSISHCKTLECLYKFGFSDPFVIWFKSYLSDRLQYIEMGDKRSKLISVSSGVPQGSHMGPWIFTIFINGITSIIHYSKVLMFADDLKIFKTVENINDTYKLQHDINSLVTWCDANLLSLNINKCKTISFHRRTNPVNQQYHINGTYLQKVTDFKDLGVTFVENMSFSNHTEQCIARANSMLGFIKRWTGDIDDIETIKILYFAYVRSQLEYAVNIWCPFYNEHIRNIESIQKKFVRYLTWKDGWQYDNELPYHVNLQQLPPYLTGCRTYNLTTLENRRELLKCSFIGNILLNEIDSPTLLESIGIKAPSRTLRKSEFLQVNIHRTNYGNNEPINMMCTSFNKIDHLFDFCLSKDSFKRKLKQYYEQTSI